MTLIKYTNSQSNYNTYATLADIDTFKEFYPFNFEDWDELDDNVKESHLYLSTKELDNSYNFISNKINDSQSLEFPRIYICNGRVPRDITHACIMNAILSFRAMRDEEKNRDNNNLKSEKIGRTLEVEYKNYKDKDIVNSYMVDFLRKYMDTLLSDYIHKGLYLCRG